MNSLRESFDAGGQTRLLAWAAATGIVAGVVAALFRLAATLLPRLLWPPADDLMTAVSIAPTWQRLLIPAAGSLVAGIVLLLGARWSGPARRWDLLEAL